MPKNPWVYKSRKRRRKTKKTPTEEELNPRLPTSSNIERSMGTLNSETLTVPLNQLKKEIIYPDTRFQRSTTLFPAMLEENCEIPRKILKRDPEEIEKDSGLEVERSSKEWSNEVMSEISLSNEVMSEISLSNDNLGKYKDITCSDSRLQRSSPHFPARGIENIIPEKHSEISGRATEDEKNVLGQELYYKMPDPSISIDAISEIPLTKSNPSKYKGTVCSDVLFQHTSALFPSEEVKVFPSETLYVTEDSLTVPEKVDMNHFTSFDHCVFNGVSNPQDEVEETDVSHQAISQLKVLEVRSIPAEKLSDTSLVYGDLNTSPEDVGMIDLHDSDYRFVSGNSNSLETVPQMVNTSDFPNFNDCDASHIPNSQDEPEEVDVTDISHRAMSQLKLLRKESIPAEELSDTSLVYGDLNTSPEDVKMIDLHDSDYRFVSGNSILPETVPEMVNTNDVPSFYHCDANHIPNSQDEAEEVDVTDISHRAMSQLKMLREEGIPTEELSETSLVYDDFETTSEEVEENDLPKSDHCVPNGFSDFQDEAEDVDVTDISHRAMSQLKMLDVGGVSAEELCETSLVYDDFETTSEEVEVNNFNYCDVGSNSDFSDDIEEIDLTEDSQRVGNQLQTFDIECIPSKRPTEALRVNDAVGMKTEKVKMNDISNSDYCVIIGNSNSPNEVEEIDLTGGSYRVLSRHITLD